MTADIACPHCGKPFTPSLGQKYCSFECGGHNKKHGLTDTIEHRAWTRIRRRCNSPSYHNYPRYGGRGIKVCARWDNFESFLADMGPKPSPEYTIERINNDGDYEPSNCKWATMAEQNNNKSNVYTPEQDQKIREAVALGYNFRRMAEYVGKPHRSVEARTYYLGLKSGQPVQKITDRPNHPLYRSGGAA